MGVLNKNHFEGQTDGVAITAANSGTFGDDAFDTVSASGGITVTYSTTASMHGTVAARFGSGNAATSGLVGYANYSATQLVQRSYFRFSALPTASDLVITQFRSSSAQLFAVRLRTDGKVGVDLPDGSTLATSTYTLSLNTWYRVESAAVVGASGGIVADVYAGDSTTSLGRLGALTGINTGTAPMVAARWGKITSAASVNTFHIDDVAVQDGTSTYLGPYAGGGPTAAGTGTNGVWTIDMAASTAGNGGTLTYTISPTTGTSQPRTGLFQGTVSGTYTVTVTESPSGGVDHKTFTVTAGAASSGGGNVGLQTKSSSGWA